MSGDLFEHFLSNSSQTTNDNHKQYSIPTSQIIVKRFPERVLKYILQSTFESVGREEAGKIAQTGGYYAGEDFLYNHLDLEDPLTDFCDKLSELNKNTSFPDWKIDVTDSNNRTFNISFSGPNDCRGVYGGMPPLYCKFMQGYLLGIFDCYMNRKNILTMYCDYKANAQIPFKGKKQCEFNISPQG